MVIGQVACLTHAARVHWAVTVPADSRLLVTTKLAVTRRAHALRVVLSVCVWTSRDMHRRQFCVLKNLLQYLRFIWGGHLIDLIRVRLAIEPLSIYHQRIPICSDLLTYILIVEWIWLKVELLSLRTGLHTGRLFEWR